MKTLRLILMLLASAVIARGATVTFTLTNSIGVPDTNIFRVWPIGDPILANGAVITKGVPIVLRPNTNGVVMTNFLQGNYLASNAWLVANFSLPGGSGTNFSTAGGFGTSKGVVFAVPNSSNSFTLDQLAISGYNTYNYHGTTDGRLISTGTINSNQFDTPTLGLFANITVPVQGVAAGSNVVVTTNGFVVTVNSTASGGVGVTAGGDSTATTNSGVVTVSTTIPLKGVAVTGSGATATTNGALVTIDVPNGGGATNAISNNGGQGTNTTFFGTLAVSSPNTNTFLTLDGSSSAEPWNKFLFSIGQSAVSNSFGEPLKDVVNSFGWNLPNSVQSNKRQAYMGLNNESGWQNYGGLTQWEYYWLFGTPTNGFGTNSWSGRWFGYTPVWDTTTKAFQGSSVGFLAETFSVESSFTNGTPSKPLNFTAASAYVGGVLDVMGDISAKTNALGVAGFNAYGGGFAARDSTNTGYALFNARTISGAGGVLSHSGTLGGMPFAIDGDSISQFNVFPNLYAAARLGVGAVSPIVKAQVNGSLLVNATKTDTAFNGDPNNDSTSQLIGTVDGWWRIRTATAGDFVLDVYNGGVGTPAVRVMQDGSARFVSTLFASNTITVLGGGTSLQLSGAQKFTSANGNILDSNGTLRIGESSGGGVSLYGTNGSSGLLMDKDGNTTNAGLLTVLGGKVSGGLVRILNTNGAGYLSLYGSTNGGSAVLYVDGSPGGQTVASAELQGFRDSFAYVSNNIGNVTNAHLYGAFFPPSSLGYDSSFPVGWLQLQSDGTMQKSFDGETLTNLDGSKIAIGTVPPARLGSGSSITSKFLRGDSTWQTIAGGGDLLAANNLSDVANVTTSLVNLGGVKTNENRAVIITNAANVIAGTGNALTFDDETYDSTGWNGDTTAPTKNAVRDKIESLSSSGGNTNVFYLTGTPSSNLRLGGTSSTIATIQSNSVGPTVVGYWDGSQLWSNQTQVTSDTYFKVNTAYDTGNGTVMGLESYFRGSANVFYQDPADGTWHIGGQYLTLDGGDYHVEGLLGVNSTGRVVISTSAALLTANNRFSGSNSISGGLRLEGPSYVSKSSGFDIALASAPALYFSTNQSCTLTTSGTARTDQRYRIVSTNYATTNIVVTLPVNVYDEATRTVISSITIEPASELTYDLAYNGTGWIHPSDGWNNPTLVNVSSNTPIAQLLTNNLPTATNLTIVSSDWIPMGAWFSNNIAPSPYTSASAITPTNTGDAFEFSDSVTNTIRYRWRPPWDWNVGTVMAELTSMSRYTNDTGSATKVTNSVFSIRMAAVPSGGTEDNLTFGTAVWTTNKINFANTNFICYKTISSAITVGNTPTSAKDVVIEISRLGAATGDTTTNIVALYGGVVLYHSRSTRADFPTATP